jgi:hypothetical protein
VTRQQRLIVSVLLTLLTAYGFYTFALKPKRDELSGLGTQITAQQDKLAQARALLQANTSAKASYQRDYASVVRLGKAVPGDDDTRSLVVQLSAAADKAGVDFRSLDLNATGAPPTAAADGTTQAVQLPPGATIGTAGFPVQPFSFEFTGDFFRLSHFLDRVDEFVVQQGDKLGVHGRLVTINGLKLEPGASGFPSIKATIDATTYLTSPLEGLTGGATAAAPAATTASTPATGGTSSGGSTATSTATSTGVIR